VSCCDLTTFGRRRWRSLDPNGNAVGADIAQEDAAIVGGEDAMPPRDLPFLIIDHPAGGSIATDREFIFQQIMRVDLLERIGRPEQPKDNHAMRLPPGGAVEDGWPLDRWNRFHFRWRRQPLLAWQRLRRAAFQRRSPADEPAGWPWR